MKKLVVIFMDYYDNCHYKFFACNNNNNFLCANILENQAQWRDKTKGLSNCVNVEQCVSRVDGWTKVLGS